ncbi:META domain-containing protein [Aquicoccus sp. SCR17]|nr:META domain-containing protein [Carideicomes alvinocaridis]
MTQLLRSTSILASVIVAGAATADSEWRIVSLNNAAVLEAPTLVFSGNGGIAGHTGCNTFTTAALLADGTLMVEAPVSTTMMACPGDALTAQDDAIIAFFEGRSASPTIRSLTR